MFIRNLICFLQMTQSASITNFQQENLDPEGMDQTEEGNTQASELPNSETSSLNMPSSDSSNMISQISDSSNVVSPTSESSSMLPTSENTEPSTDASPLSEQLEENVTKNESEVTITNEPENNNKGLFWLGVV